MSDPPSPPAAPARVGGRYVLLEELGRGGMASVYRARDSVLDRHVAVKLLHPHLANDTAFLDRFRREARAAAALSHPNVVGVHDWGESRDGAYLVLQLVEGPTLRQLLRQHGPLTAEEAAGIMIPVAQGLGAAHHAGLVHRDVKPENLLLGRDGTVRVTDFGLARAVASSTMTFGADVLVGSPHYLSPEAVNGDRLDPRADVYALGVVLFECLTGRPPHNGESAFATAVRHTSTTVPAPSSVVDGIEPGMDDVVRWATAIERDRRYRTGDDFARALSNAVARPVPVIGLVSDIESAVHRRPSAPTDQGRNGGPALFDLDAKEDGDRPADRPGRGAADASVIPSDALDDDMDPDDIGDHFDDASGGTSVLRADDDHDTDIFGPARRRSGWLVAFVVLALIVGSGVGGYLLWDRVIAPVLPIPEVVGVQRSAAEARLADEGFVADVTGARHDLEAPAGTVIEQDPVGDARRGTEVDLVLSDGPRPVDVPQVEGETAVDAREALREVGLEIVEEERFDEQVPAGTVISSEPAAGDVVDEASTVVLQISRGPTPIDVPELTDQSLDAATETARGLGLELEVGERRFHPTVPEGHVIDQQPAPGTTLTRGDLVEIFLSDGPAPIEVPTVRDLDVAEAVAMLDDLGFEVEVDRRGGLGALLRPGQVFDQDPGPGSTRFAGDVITLFAYND